MPLYMTLAFLTVVSGLGFGLSAYGWSRLQTLAYRGWPYEGTQALLAPLDDGWFWGVSTVLTTSYFVIGKLVPTRPLRWLGWLSGLWMGYLALCLFLLGPLHLAEQVVGLFWTSGEWLGNVTARLTLLGFHLAFVFALARVLAPPKLGEVEVVSPRIGPELDGLRIVQLSDVHIGPTIGPRFIEHLHRRVAALDPDLIVMTGDLVDGEPRFLTEDVTRFLALKQYATHGLVFITGNHEYISGASAWVDLIRAQGVTVLENEHLTLTKGDDAFHLIGVEDWDGRRFDRTRGPHLKRAMAGIEDSPLFKLLLAHQPKAAPEARDAGIDLQLSGHTHGGQIFPMNLLVQLDQPYVGGQYALGNMTLYVNPGTGYWGPPLRLGTRSEITLVTLRRPA